jgi:hypothetical protein
MYHQCLLDKIALEDVFSADAINIFDKMSAKIDSSI